MSSFESKVAVVTGAGSGIGRELAIGWHGVGPVLVDLRRRRRGPERDR